MLDAKILTAVFASLLATATAFGGGSLDTDNIEIEDDLEEEFSFMEFAEDPWEKVKDMFTTRPEPENSVKASLTVENLDQQNLNVRNSGSVHVDGMNSVDIGPKSVTSEENIVLHGFRGTLKPGNVSSIEGRYQSLVSSGVNISGATSIEHEVNTTSIEFRNVERSPIKFMGVGGEIESSDASTTFSEGSRAVDINSFSGDIKVFVQNETVLLDGKVDRLEAGGFSFGS